MTNPPKRTKQGDPDTPPEDLPDTPSNALPPRDEPRWKRARKREKTGRTLTKTEQSLRLDFKLVGTNKPDPKTPNYTLLKVMRSAESPNDYVIILDIPGKNADFREGAKYKVHPPHHASHLAPNLHIHTTK